MTYTWRFLVDVAHLTDEQNHTACNRQLEHSDPPSESWDGKSHKCKTCALYELKLKEVLCPMLEGYVLATRCKGCSREATCPKEPKTVLNFIVKEGSGEKKNEI
jgi:hypothetical protein